MVPPKKYRYFFTWNKEQFLENPMGVSENKIVSKKKIHPKHQQVHRPHEPKTVKIDIPTTY